MNMTRLATHDAWLKMVASAAAASAASASASGDANASFPMSEMEFFGSNVTSSNPGPMYRTALRIEASPPHATSLSKNWGRNRTLSTDSSPPRQYTAEKERTTGWSGAISARVVRTAGAGCRSSDGTFSGCTPLVRAALTTVAADGPGLLPASTWTSRGG